MQHDKINFAFLNIGHFLDHFFMLIFATVVALHLTDAWALSYSELIPYATPGFIAFGTCALISGWIADKWNRQGMMLIFFIGIGLSSIFSGFANDPVQISIGLFFIGVFASIYHPVGLAMVVEGRTKTGLPLAINGVFGNMGVASAALVTGLLIDFYGWQSAFLVPGGLSVLIGILYFFNILNNKKIVTTKTNTKSTTSKPESVADNNNFIRVFAVIFFSTAVGGFIFQSTTFSLPKVIDEVLNESATVIGWYAFLIFSFASIAQLIVGYLIDNYSIKRVFTILAFAQSLLFYAMTVVSDLYALLIAAGFMLFVFGQIPINDVLVSRLVKSQWRSRAFAIRYVITFTVMALALPLIAWIHSQWGFLMLFLVLAVASFCIFISTLFLPKVIKAS